MHSGRQPEPPPRGTPVRQPRLAAGRARAVGLPTRGTTNPNRLRRMDNWLTATQADRLRADPSTVPLVIDLGFGDSPITVLELQDRLRSIRPDVRLLGLELDPARVAGALSASRAGLSFGRGGFELAGQRALLVRAANVLRQYPESAVAPAWQRMIDQLQPGGAVVEGTCDEWGRRASWVLLEQTGPVSLTLSCRLSYLNRPSDVADRLVKALIHRNVAGSAIHALLQAMDRAWDRHAALANFGNRQRWQAMCAELAGDWPVLSTARRHRFGELTVAWSAVAPD